MNDRTNFSYYETEAQRLATRIRDLKALTPEFIEVRDQAQRQMEHHFRLIEETEGDLDGLRKQAAQAAMQLGVESGDGAAEALAEEQRQIGLAPDGGLAKAYYSERDAMRAIGKSTPTSELPALADLPAEEQAAVDAILNDDTPFPGMADPVAADPAANDHFTTVGEVAEQITAALADIAGDQPETEDQTDAPELTTEQVERVEADMAEALKAYA